MSPSGEAPMPTFLIIGAAKAGTTALFGAIRQHPDVFMPALKEPQYFAFAGQRLDFKGPGVTINDSVTDPADYAELFAGAEGAAAVGEASNLYLCVPGTAERIDAALPGVRLVAILRQPAERAFSSYLHLKREGREPVASFEEALACEEQRIADGWGFLWRYRELGYYGRQLRPYLDRFGAERILVHLYDDFVADPLRVVRDTYRFVGVDPGFRPDLSARPNQGGVPRAGWRRSLARGGVLRRAGGRLVPGQLRGRLRDAANRQSLAREAIMPETRARLTGDFRDDIHDLGSLLGRDLGAWLKAAG